MRWTHTRRLFRPKFFQPVLAAALLTGFMLTSTASLRAQAAVTPPVNTAIKVGDMAPDFKLRYADASGMKEVQLSDYRGKKNVILAFYIFAFTGG